MILADKIIEYGNCCKKFAYVDKKGEYILYYYVSEGRFVN